MFQPGQSGNPNGRPKGARSKTNELLREAIIEAAKQAGDGDLVGYLKARAIDTPGPFLALIGKVLPLQVGGDDDNPLRIDGITELLTAINGKTRSLP